MNRIGRNRISRDAALVTTTTAAGDHVDCEISDAAIQRVARCVPSIARDETAEWLRAAGVAAQLDRIALAEGLTRRQLEEELRRLSRGDKPSDAAALDWVLQRIYVMRRQHLLVEKFGSPMPRLTPNQHRAVMPAIHQLRQDDEAARRDPGVLRRLVSDHRAELLRQPPHIGEELRLRSALKPALASLVSNACSFWVGPAKQPFVIDKRMMQFVDAMLQTFGFRLKASAIKWRLEQERKSRHLRS